MAISNDDMLQDLKQFIDAKFSMQDASIDDRFEIIDSRFNRIDRRFDKIDEQLVIVKDDIEDLKAQSNTILDVLGGDIVEVQKTQNNHEHRITKLETAQA